MTFHLHWQSEIGLRLWNNTALCVFCSAFSLVLPLDEIEYEYGRRRALTSLV